MTQVPWESVHGELPHQAWRATLTPLLLCSASGESLQALLWSSSGAQRNLLTLICLPRSLQQQHGYCPTAFLQTGWGEGQHMFPRSHKYGLEAQESQQGTVTKVRPWFLASCMGEKKKQFSNICGVFVLLEI